jgi:hypothetical protein
MEITNTNKDIGYINHEELVFNPDNTIQSGGFSVASIFMKSGISPIMTMNDNTDNILQNGGSNKVSDLFQNLAVPNWAIMYKMTGGEYKDKDDNETDSDIDDELHDKLLGLVREHQETKSKKNNKSKKMENRERKNITKKKRKQKQQ